MSTSSPDATPPPPLTFGLWAGILAGPLLWTLDQQANYLLVYWARPTGTVFAMQMVTFACAAAAAGSAAACWAQWRAARRELATGAANPGWGRIAFMAGLGALLSLLFVVAIIAFGLPPLFVDVNWQ
jgi:hypothetical protein